MAQFERWLEVKRIFEEALEVACKERGAFLDRICGDDEELRREVDALLMAPALPTSSLAGLFGLPNRQEEPDYMEGDRIDHFAIVRRVGKGGMGTVYEARDIRNNDRRVAIKVLSSRAAGLSQDKRLAGLSHPAIVTFHDSGETPEGLPYFVFEYIEGEPITAYCERRKLSVSDRLRLFEKVCEAVAYAHQRLVIHCDLKPENILVTATGELKLLDFGIAKEVGAAGSAAGEPSPITLPFASPEQVAEEETTTLSDVYSLGVLLSVLLAGRLPYRKARTVSELRDAILHEEPGRPSELVLSGANEQPLYGASPAMKRARDLSKRLRGDLDAIPVKALRKEPSGRYQSAVDLANDIRRHLADRPVEARGPSRRYRAWKLLKRHRGGAAVAALFAFVILAAIVLWLGQYREAVHERDAARQEAARAEEVSRFLTDLFKVSDPQRSPGGAVTARELLDRAARDLPQRLQRQPSTKVHLLNTLGEIYQVLGLLPESDQCHAAALTIARASLGPNDLQIAETLTDLATIRQRQGKFREAEAMHREALRIRENQRPVNSRDVAASIYGVGTALQDEQRFKEAEPYLRKTVDLLRQNPKTDPGEIAQALNALGALLASAQRPEEAEPVLRECLALRERLYGPIHPLLATTLANLASVLDMEAKFDEAIALWDRSLAINRRVFGEDHPNVVVVLNGLGFVYLKKGDNSRALIIFREALLKAHPNTAQEHPRAVVIRLNLSHALLSMGRIGEAQAVLEEAYDVGLRRFGKDSPTMASILSAQAECLVLQNDLPDAEHKLLDAIQIFREQQGGASYKVVTTRSLLGDVFTREGRFPEAEPLLLAYYKLAIPRDKKEALQRLVRLYDLWHEPEKAAAYRKLLAQLLAR